MHQEVCCKGDEAVAEEHGLQYTDLSDITHGVAYVDIDQDGNVVNHGFQSCDTEEEAIELCRKLQIEAAECEINRRLNDYVASIQEQLGPGYTVSRVDNELFREYRYHDGNTYVIERPMILIRREGGSTHRIIDIKHGVHLPPLADAVIYYEPRDKSKPCQF